MTELEVVAWRYRIKSPGPGEYDGWVTATDRDYIEGFCTRMGYLIEPLTPLAPAQAEIERLKADLRAAQLMCDVRSVGRENAEAEAESLRNGLSRLNEDVCQTLGKALGYPWFKDDQANFLGATEENGVCVGDHVAESIADEAARALAAERVKVADLEAENARLLTAFDGLDLEATEKDRG